MIYLGIAVLILAGLLICEIIKRKELIVRLQLAENEAKKVSILQSALSEKDKELQSAHINHQVAQEKFLLLSQAQEALKTSFQSLSFEALAKNNTIFLELAQTTLEKFQEGAKEDLKKRQDAIGEMFTPVKETLKKLDTGMRDLEIERKGASEALKEQLRALLENERQLKQETSKLVKALHAPAARGRWGEIQLKRVVELAGMLSHCDFFEQQQGQDEDGKYRPDLIVRLPGGRQVVIDAKAPLEAYLDAIQMTDEHQKENKLKDHARQVRAHVSLLGKKGYWERFHPTPEFVVLFLPAETFFSTALEYDPSLIEAGAVQKVIIATPTTLIALLRAVSYGWQQESLSRHVEELHNLGKDLYKRLIDMSSHWTKMGRSLTGAVDAYNKGMGSLETRVLVSARKLKEMGITQGEIEIDPIETIDELSPLSHHFACRGGGSRAMIGRCFLLFALCLNLNNADAHECAVTNETPGGRFGDQLIAYMHAKWISYQYDIPLLYKPFCYSNELALDDAEKVYRDADVKSFQHVLIETLDLIEQNASPDALFIVPYFPESPYELKLTKWPYFPVNWKDPQFISMLRSLISPKHPTPQTDLPNHRTTVAVHVRKGGGFDDPLLYRHWPLKFPPDDFYIEQIRKIYELLKEPLFIHIFTDDPQPNSIAESYAFALSDIDAVFDYRLEGNSYKTNVLADLFDMMRYDCLIRPESNYSIVAEKLGDFKIVINPAQCILKDKQIVITEICLQIKD